MLKLINNFAEKKKWISSCANIRSSMSVTFLLTYVFTRGSSYKFLTPTVHWSIILTNEWSQTWDLHVLLFRRNSLEFKYWSSLFHHFLCHLSPGKVLLGPLFCELYQVKFSAWILATRSISLKLLLLILVFCDVFVTLCPNSFWKCRKFYVNIFRVGLLPKHWMAMAQWFLCLKPYFSSRSLCIMAILLHLTTSAMKRSLVFCPDQPNVMFSSFLGGTRYMLKLWFECEDTMHISGFFFCLNNCLQSCQPAPWKPDITRTKAAQRQNSTIQFS